MALPNTTNLSPIQCTARPDWRNGCTIAAQHATAITTARTGQEQRSRGRITPIYRLSYQQNGLTRAQYQARMQAAAQEVARPVLVPFWPLAARFVSNPPNANTGTIDIEATAEWFQPDQWLYIYRPSGPGQFRQIATVTDGHILTFQATTGALTWLSGDYLAPARLCRRIIDEDQAQRQALTSFSERFQFETIDAV